ncbi:hypothetical protein [Pontibacter ummariensis]|nr:hypothetical protein [Pontibacter ummariensis]
MAVIDAGGTVLFVSAQSASLYKVKLVESVLGERFIAQLPEKLIDDKAYNSHPLGQVLSQQGIEMIALYRGIGKDIRC